MALGITSLTPSSPAGSTSESAAWEAKLFGAGIYLAENSSKSDEYCRPDSRGICSIKFLIRAVLGMPYEAEQPMPNTRLPLASADSGPHDSVIGVTSNTHPSAWLHNYREFILYDAAGQRQRASTRW
ncbi:hypothetical protein GUITHDRAFT_116705 [Guillardia theta CCMP2712]|uniref:PARP catalytic domain-containing protein n=1 Tax=Guillardia theta (strain CCMP2712) TaxID=905079 RepID=L1ILJ9_GUITC|nr:hypothetical protein GUITHDRAFT_116705 [Guillardia theta CCMP2712]EKX37126.1 hypothetical protein GUITHDRAFT_116705 [Guillardia theta CCMP2712]|eukprot:XP_005824106.1 hypothetical protein GUITHDRAFT_116705 [Guillardia theta CCMP2712]